MKKSIKLFVMFFVIVLACVLGGREGYAYTYKYDWTVDGKTTNLTRTYRKNSTGDYVNVPSYQGYYYEIYNNEILASIDLKFKFYVRTYGNLKEGDKIDCYIKTSSGKEISCLGQGNGNEATVDENGNWRTYYGVTIDANNLKENFSGKLYVGNTGYEVCDINVTCIEEINIKI